MIKRTRTATKSFWLNSFLLGILGALIVAGIHSAGLDYRAELHAVTQIRHGRLRCMGSFGHPILAGTFGALLIPLSVILWFKESKRRLLAVATLLSGTFVTIASGSSGPVITYVCVIVGLLMRRFWMHMRAIVWGTIFALSALHFIMKAPVWFLASRISGSVGGGTGWYRSLLIDKAIRHFDEWWLLGTDRTIHWTGFAMESDPNMTDIPNFYIRQGVDGGVLTMVMFVFVLALCFRSVGNALRIMENHPLATKITLWCIGSMLFAHAVTFLSVTYFDQTIVFWYLLLAIISTISDVYQTTNDEVCNRTISPKMPDFQI